MSISILRYPGGKSKSAHSFVALINGHSQYEYREPLFFGGGSVGLQVIMQSDHRSYWINDYDVDIAALWQCVAQHPDEPKAAIMKVVPSLPEFDGLKAYFLSRPPMPSDSAELIRMGCGKLALHRMSWSGVGAMGGPLGGRHQSGRQKIDGRWNPVSLCEKIDKITTRSSGVTITSVDYSELILDESRPAILYLDPPYHG